MDTMSLKSHFCLLDLFGLIFKLKFSNLNEPNSHADYYGPSDMPLPTEPGFVILHSILFRQLKTGHEFLSASTGIITI